MVQLGLCSFRQGMTKDAHNALVDIQSGGRAKELLAQVRYSYFGDKSIEYCYFCLYLHEKICCVILF